MSGFREFMPGQVWFYYNPHATKDQERKKELGAITSRPVVIIQAAFYPEWNDIVTVCPMTHSDRRSGVYIDTTICKDGSLIEGGTVLPYLFHNVKTKFLYPMIATNHKRKLLSLSPEDFEKVRQGYLYHLGETMEEPDYVKNWKHVKGYDREIILRDVHLAINDNEDLALDDHDEHRKKPRKCTNPVLVQKEAPSETVENHIIASLSAYNRAERVLFDPTGEFTHSKVGDPEPDQPVTEKHIRHNHEIGFTKMSTEDFATKLAHEIDGIFPVASDKHIYPGSKYLEGVELKQMIPRLSINDQIAILNMTIADIVTCSGIGSKSTASRLRKEIRESDLSKIDEHLACPDGFCYVKPSFGINKVRAKKNAYRHHLLFKHSKEELAIMIEMPQNDFYKTYPEIPRSYYRQFITEAMLLCSGMKLHPAQEEVPAEPVEEAVDPMTVKFKLWETLSPAELREVHSTSRKHTNSVMKNFGIDRESAQNLWREVTQVIGKHQSLVQPEIDASQLESSCIKIISGKFDGISHLDLLAFCRSDPLDIAKCFSTIKSANTPAKSNIRSLKRDIRKLIVE